MLTSYLGDWASKDGAWLKSHSKTPVSLVLSSSVLVMMSVEAAEPVLLPVRWTLHLKTYSYRRCSERSQLTCRWCHPVTSHCKIKMILTSSSSWACIGQRGGIIALGLLHTPTHTTEDTLNILTAAVIPEFTPPLSTAISAAKAWANFTA